jgi:acyl-CoA synthetase (AMP-forming)/AMP-acid ligase II
VSGAKPSLVHGEPLESEPFLGPLTIASYARDVTRRFGAAEAMVGYTPDGTRYAWSYDDLWDRSMAVARALVAAGVAKDERVGVLMTNRPEHVAALFGIALAGAVTVSLSTFSTPDELAYLLKASAASTLLYDRQVLKKDFGAILCGLVPALDGPPPLASADFPFLRSAVALDAATASAAPSSDPSAVATWDAFLASGRDVPDAIVEARAASVSPSDAGAIFFSSGTTSLPKGILHSQRAFCIQWWRWRRTMDLDPVNHPVRCWTGNGFFWSGNISQVIGYALSTGGAIILQPVFDAEEALRLISAERVSFAIGRPHQWARLEASPGWAATDLSSLHYVTYGSKIFDHPTVSTDWRTSVAFGTTETLTIIAAVCANAPEEDFRGYGRPLPGNTIKIVDPATGTIVPQGTRGEIGIKGPTLMLGYLGKPAEESFDADGFYLTGDGGYVDEDGYLFWEGRLTDIIKTGGANVAPVEVDAVLSQCPGVKRGQTVGLADEMLGEMVVSCIVPHDGATLDAGTVQGFLKERLASFKVPRAVLFFEEHEFAVTGSEKVKVGALRELAQARLRGGGGAA